jgi:hypothetical protein
LQRRLGSKGAISCGRICEMGYLVPRFEISAHS